MQPTEWIWKDGELVPWAQATTHVMTHALHYGSSVFEGIRAYATPRGVRFFRLGCHLDRLVDSARIYGMPMRWTAAQLANGCKTLVAKNRMPAAYVRPLVYRGYGNMGLDPTNCPVETVVAAWDWGRYLTGKNPDEGVDVCISSWRRVAGSTLPAMAKAGGNYLSSQLIRLEAKRNGYAEGIALTTDGTISEASGENVFVVLDGVVYTPDIASSILLGITRDSAIKLLRAKGVEVREARLPRELLHAADEVFLTGTAAEITPVRSIDRTVVRDGTIGPVTRALRQNFFGLFDGTAEDAFGWLTDLTVS
jgi:branched-chain amino acid aminotransferase